jgi:hypothetical protein
MFVAVVVLAWVTSRLSPGFTTWFYGVDGELYATFDSFALDPNQTPPTIAHVFVSPAVYRINPATGNATFVAQTDLMLTAFVDVDGSDGDRRNVPHERGVS